jgi:hypothetical protein
MDGNSPYAEYLP